MATANGRSSQDAVPACINSSLFARWPFWQMPAEGQDCQFATSEPYETSAAIQNASFLTEQGNSPLYQWTAHLRTAQPPTA